MGEQTSEPLLIPYRELGFGGARPYLSLHLTGLDLRGRADLMRHFDITSSERRQECLLVPAEDAT